MEKTASKLLRPRHAPVITTLSSNNQPNAAPMSFVSILASKPEIIALGAHPITDTFKNICLRKEFVLNLISKEDIDKYLVLGKKYPYGTNELRIAGLTWAKGYKIQTPYIKESLASIECKLRKQLKIADRTISFGEVVHVRVAKNYSIDKIQLHFNKTKFFDTKLYRDLGISEEEYRKSIGREKDYLPQKNV